MIRPFFSLILGVACLALFTQCSKETVVTTGPLPVFESDASRLTTRCEAEINSLYSKTEKISQLPLNQVSRENSLLALEEAVADFYDQILPLYFMADVGGNKDLREAGLKCKTAQAQALLKVYSTPELYLRVKAVQNTYGDDLPLPEKRLLQSHLDEFITNGLTLYEKGELEKFKSFNAKAIELSDLKSGYNKNIATIQVPEPTTVAELKAAGLSDLIETCETGITGHDGKPTYAIPLTSSVFIQVMENSTDANLRKRVNLAYERRGGERNLTDLKRALVLRDEMAKMLGFKNHSESVLSRRMAKTPEAVLAFLNKYKEKLAPLGKQNVEGLLAEKKKTDPAATEIYAWDWRYYQNQLRKAKNFDEEALRDYFPLDTVTKGMFEIYETLLDVKFEEDKSAQTWHPEVRAFKILQGQKTIATFYMDLFPRKSPETKYTHAAMFPLRQGRVLADGSYLAPIGSIVCNFRKPADGGVPRLSHDEVETYFHEFGHVMHHTLSKAKYSSISGANVKWDFVEAPSQMLENWVWKKEGLQKLSGHYKNPSQKLPEDKLQALLDIKYFNSGIFWLRQIGLGLVDITMHMDATVDTKKVYSDVMSETMGIKVQEGSWGIAGIGHFMGGYDSGYYGYMWSKQFAEDMFTRFEPSILSRSVGYDYRKYILEPGATEEPLALVESFLGRKVDEAPFEKSLGLHQLQ